MDGVGNGERWGGRKAVRGGIVEKWVGWGGGRGLCERLMRENVGVGGLSWKGVR